MAESLFSRKAMPMIQSLFQWSIWFPDWGEAAGGRAPAILSIYLLDWSHILIMKTGTSPKDPFLQFGSGSREQSGPQIIMWKNYASCNQWWCQKCEFTTNNAMILIRHIHYTLQFVSFSNTQDRKVNLKMSIIFLLNIFSKG